MKIATFCGDKKEYKRSLDFKSNVFIFLLDRNAECKMFFGKGRQISSGPLRKSMPPR